MVLVIFLILAALAGLILGIVKKRKAIIISSAIGLLLIAMILIVYQYLYSLTPY